jgi:hypothetical protein
MEPRFLRIVYAAEFLLALIAVFTAWSQVGGQGHLDLMAWYLKLSLGLAMAYAIVRATSAASGEERGWNGKTLRWIGVLALLAAVAGVITYYYHLYEPSDEEEDQPTTQSSVGRTSRPPGPASVNVLLTANRQTGTSAADQEVCPTKPELLYPRRLIHVQLGQAPGDPHLPAAARKLHQQAAVILRGATAGEYFRSGG